VSIKHLLKQAVQTRVIVGYEDPFYQEGPIYETEDIPARVVEKTRLVRSPTGSEIVSDTEVWTEERTGDELVVDEVGRSVQSRETMVGLDGRVVGHKSFL